MKIIDINIQRHDMKLKAPWAIAGRVTESVENIFIEIITDQEISGMGAGAPSPDVTGETIQNAFDRLQLMSSKIIGWDLVNKKDLFTQLESELRAFPATRAAIDMALFDALAQSEGKSVVEHLGQVHQCLPTSITIGVESFDKTIEDAKRNIEKGFSILKIKIGENIDEDIEKIFALSELGAEDLLIRVDANRGYNVKELEQFFEKTQHLGLELIEQPLPKDQIKEMLNFPEELRHICVADESLHSPDDAHQLTKGMKPFGVFNIKLMKCGGIYPALEIARIAENEGIGLMWGCMDESKISITAALHAALASPATKFLDLDGFFDLGWDLMSGGYICEHGVMQTNQKPGLGLYHE